MARVVRTLAFALLGALLPGCAVTLHGHQALSGGMTTTTTSSTVSGSAKLSGARVSFVSGPVVPANAPGGQITLDRGPAAVLVLGLVVADVVQYFSAKLGARPPQTREAIADTCSCYQKPVSGER
ncbi:MAG: hypothetical protein FJY54_11275 [Betaproteobacteria bacterium]|nr:hypothetical protein [Betaproteobacteria bacterium]